MNLSSLTIVNFYNRFLSTYKILQIVETLQKKFEIDNDKQSMRKKVPEIPTVPG